MPEKVNPAWAVSAACIDLIFTFASRRAHLKGDHKTYEQSSSQGGCKQKVSPH